MNLEIKELINCLNIEKDIYEKVAQLSVVKKEVIIKGNVNELESIIESEHALIKEINVVELKRNQLVKKISNFLSIDSEAVTIADIIKKTDNLEQKNQLSKLLDEFKTIINKQKEFNKTNQSLIEKNLNYIDFMMNTVLLGNDNLTYNYEGSDNTKKQKVNIFDQRV